MISKETSAMWVVLAHCGEMYITEQTPCCSVNMSYQLCDSWMPLELPPFTLQTMIKKKTKQTLSLAELSPACVSQLKKHLFTQPWYY